MKRLLLLAVVVFLASAAAMPAAQRAFTIEDLYRVQTVSDVHISPDGQWAVFVVATTDLPKAKRNTHVWMIGTDGKNLRQLTQSEKSESAPRFSPDGKWISFISGRDGKDNLYLLPVNGGEAKQLTHLSTGVADPLWAPDSSALAFSTDVYPECGADDACNEKIADTWHEGPLKAHLANHLLYRHWTQWKDGTRTHIFLARVATGEVQDLTPGDFDSPVFQLGGPLEYDFSPDGKEFVYQSNHDPDPESSTNSDLWMISLSDTTPHPRNLTASNPAYDGSPQFSPDGKYIAYRMQKQPRYESDLFRLAIYDRAAGTSTVLTETFRNWIDSFRWADDSKSIYFSADVEGLVPLYRLDLSTKAITPALSDKTIDDFELVPGDKHLLYIKRSVGEPSELYSAALENGKAFDLTPLTHFNSELRQEVDIRPAETMWVEGSGGVKIQVFIVKPHDFNPRKKYPLILNVHGGPQSQWEDSFRGDWQVYPGAGYIVAFANPHGSTGFGQDFTAEISGDYGGFVFSDLMKVTDALEKLPYVDANSMGAMGWSFGGYMMDWFEGHTDRFKAIASMMGLFDLPAFYGATEELWFPEWDLKGRPWNSELYEKWSPSSAVKNFKTPCLVISGERDFRVPYTQSLEFFTALQKMNVPSRLIIYSNAGHWPSWYEMALYYTAHLEWFHQYLGGGVPPWTSEQFLRNAVFDTKTGKRAGEKLTK
ncbi:MAG: S9 family peptidase [Acidobacteriia bacterium]|nr:S9 family peptidase [Terriglobia bacterium]